MHEINFDHINQDYDSAAFRTASESPKRGRANSKNQLKIVVFTKSMNVDAPTSLEQKLFETIRQTN
jgi:hypothetical protein